MSMERQTPALDPAIAAILDERPTSGAADLEQARDGMLVRNAPWNATGPSLQRIEDLQVPGEGGSLPLRLYVGAAEVPGTILYLHGGGWILGSIDTHDGICRRLAANSGLRVLSLDYRLAPEHPYPAALDDACLTVDWLRGAARDLAPGPLGLAGDSAGANLALATALRLKAAGRPQVDWLGLIYGAYARDFATGSYATFGTEAYGLSTGAMRWFWDAYAPGAAKGDPFLAPLEGNPDFTGLPPAFIGVAGCDPLADENRMLAKRLIDAGIAVDFRFWAGLTHGCMHWAARVPAVARALDQVGEAAALAFRSKNE